MSVSPGPLSKARRRVIADLATRAGRERQGLFLLEGRRAIEDALTQRADLTDLVVTRETVDIARSWREGGRLHPECRIHLAADGELSSLSDTSTPQGILAIGKIPSLDLAGLSPRAGGTASDAPLLVVDGIQDPGNLGTLFRTLLAVGGRIALCTRGTVDPYNPRVLRGSAGAIFAIDLAAGMTARQAAHWCAEREYPLVALSARAPDLFGMLRAGLPAGPLAIAVGNEGAGISSGIEERASFIAGLPMAEGIDSLSAAVAGSIALYACALRLVPAGRP